MKAGLESGIVNETRWIGTTLNRSEWTVHRPGVPPMSEVFSQVWRRRELFVLFVLRDLRVRYAQVLMGAIWVVLQPAITMAIMTVVFSRIAHIRPGGAEPYFIWCFAGLLPFQYFSRALTACSSILVQNGSLLTKVSFPRLLLLLAALCPPLLDFVLSLGFLVLMMLWFSTPISGTVVVLPLFLVYAALLVFALGTWSSAICVRYRDIQHMLPFLLQGLMLLTPIAYPASLVPPGWLRTIFLLNPLALIVDGCRWSLLSAPAPEPLQYATIPCVFALLAGGLWHFRWSEQSFADVV